MTKWQEFPLRPQGRPWAGINTRSGKLDDGTGQMTDNSVNVIINRGDKLEKRKGMIRGLDERFATVCGLHKYTDECGREWLIVADEGGFSIRQPFAIPSFASTDAYPSDSFQTDGPVDSYRWRGVAGYTQSGSALVLVAGETNPGDLTWFKSASNFSYKSAIRYTVDEGSTVVAVIKAGVTARLEARVNMTDGNVVVTLVHVDSTGSETELGIGGTGAVTTGFLILSYNRNLIDFEFTVRLEVTPTDQSTFVLEDLTTLNALDNADLGQSTALRLENLLGTSSGSVLGILGGPL